MAYAPSAAAFGSQTDVFWWGEGALWEAWETTGAWSGPAVIFVDKCNPGRTNDNVRYWDGWERDFSYEIGGVQSYELNYSPWVWPQYLNSGLHNASSAWALLADGSAHYEQVGYQEYAWRTTYVCSVHGPIESVRPPITHFLDPAKPVFTYTWYTVLNNYYYTYGETGWVTFRSGNCPNGADCTMEADPKPITPNVAQISGEYKRYQTRCPEITLCRNI